MRELRPLNKLGRERQSKTTKCKIDYINRDSSPFTSSLEQLWHDCHISSREHDMSVHDIGISADNRCLDDALVPQVPHVLLL